MTDPPRTAGRGGVDGVPGDAPNPGPVQPEADQALLGLADAARYLGISAATIHRWAGAGRVRFTTAEGRGMRFARADLDAVRFGRPRGSDGPRDGAPR